MIANAFFRAGMVESWGRSIEKITNVCRNTGNRDSVIEFKRNLEIAVIFYSDVNIIIGVTGNGASKGTVIEIQRKLLRRLFANPRDDNKNNFYRPLGINEHYAKMNLKEVKDAVLIERVCSARGGY